MVKKTENEKFLTKLDRLIAKARAEGKVSEELLDGIESEAYRIQVNIDEDILLIM